MNIFKKIESNYGKVYLSHTIFYIIVFKNGISEEEIINILKIDKDIEEMQEEEIHCKLENFKNDLKEILIEHEKNFKLANANVEIDAVKYYEEIFNELKNNSISFDEYHDSTLMNVVEYFSSRDINHKMEIIHVSENGSIIGFNNRKLNLFIDIVKQLKNFNTKIDIFLNDVFFDYEFVLAIILNKNESIFNELLQYIIKDSLNNKFSLTTIKNLKDASKTYIDNARYFIIYHWLIPFFIYLKSGIDDRLLTKFENEFKIFSKRLNIKNTITPVKSNTILHHSVSQSSNYNLIYVDEVLNIWFLLNTPYILISSTDGLKYKFVMINHENNEILNGYLVSIKSSCIPYVSSIPLNDYKNINQFDGGIVFKNNTSLFKQSFKNSNEELIKNFNCEIISFLMISSNNIIVLTKSSLELIDINLKVTLNRKEVEYSYIYSNKKMSNVIISPDIDSLPTFLFLIDKKKIQLAGPFLFGDNIRLYELPYKNENNYWYDFDNLFIDRKYSIEYAVLTKGKRQDLMENIRFDRKKYIYDRISSEFIFSFSCFADKTILANIKILRDTYEIILDEDDARTCISHLYDIYNGDMIIYSCCGGKFYFYNRQTFFTELAPKTTDNLEKQIHLINDDIYKIYQKKNFFCNRGLENNNLLLNNFMIDYENCELFKISLKDMTPLKERNLEHLRRKYIEDYSYYFRSHNRMLNRSYQRSIIVDYDSQKSIIVDDDSKEKKNNNSDKIKTLYTFIHENCFLGLNNNNDRIIASIDNDSKKLIFKKTKFIMDDSVNFVSKHFICAFFSFYKESDICFIDHITNSENLLNFKYKNFETNHFFIEDYSSKELFCIYNSSSCEIILQRIWFNFDTNTLNSDEVAIVKLNPNNLPSYHFSYAILNKRFIIIAFDKIIECHDLEAGGDNPIQIANEDVFGMSFSRLEFKKFFLVPMNHSNRFIIYKDESKNKSAFMIEITSCMKVIKEIEFNEDLHVRGKYIFWREIGDENIFVYDSEKDIELFKIETNHVDFNFDFDKCTKIDPKYLLLKDDNEFHIYDLIAQQLAIKLPKKYFKNVIISDKYIACLLDNQNDPILSIFQMS